jgi:hypothetical protein
MRHTLVFVCVALLSPLPLRAWGPVAHVTLGRAVLHRVMANPNHPLAFLAAEPYRSIFLRSSMSPDMTLSLFAARKINPQFNRYFHTDTVSDLMVTDAAARQAWDQLAFALGWRSHRVADDVLRRPGSIIYRNLFGFAKTEKRSVIVAMPDINKFCIDCMMIRDQQTEAMEPYIDAPLLVRSLKTYLASKGVTTEDPAKLIPEFFSDFKWSCSTLFTVAQTVSANQKAFPALTQELMGDPAEEEQGPTPSGTFEEFPIFEDAVDVIEASLIKACGGIELPEVENFEQPKTAAKPGIAERAARRVEKMASAGTRFLWSSMPITRKLRQVVVDQSVRLINSVGSDGSVRQRLLLTFAADMVNGTRDWPQIKKHVHQMVEKVPGE